MLAAPFIMHMTEDRGVLMPRWRIYECSVGPWVSGRILSCAGLINQKYRAWWCLVSTVLVSQFR